MTVARGNGTDPELDLQAMARDRSGDAGQDLGFWRRLRIWSERIAAAKAVLAVIICLFAGAGASLLYVQSFARRADVERGARHDVAQDLRLSLLERDLEWIARTLYDLSIRSGARPAPPPERSTP